MNKDNRSDASNQDLEEIRCALRGSGEFKPVFPELQSAAQSDEYMSDAAPEGWQPIETAPKGAKGYSWMNLAWGPEGDQSAGIGMRWGDRFFAVGTFYCLGQQKQYEFREIEVNPTHWMPLPDAPDAVREATGAQS
jgi:hypothetical protein